MQPTEAISTLTTRHNTRWQERPCWDWLKALHRPRKYNIAKTKWKCIPNFNSYAAYQVFFNLYYSLYKYITSGRDSCSLQYQSYIQKLSRKQRELLQNLFSPATIRFFIQSWFCITGDRILVICSIQDWNPLPTV